MLKLVLRAACGGALVLASGCGEGEKGGSADTSAQFVAAADPLAARLASGQVPPASDPVAKAYEAEAVRALKALGTPALPDEGFESFQKLCGKAANIVGGYVSVGTETVPAAARPAAMERNLEARFDQLFNPLLFSAHCSAAHLPFLAETVGDKTGDRTDALAQVRTGAFGQASGLIEMAQAEGVEPARRRQILDLLAQDAAHFAIALNPAQRQQLVASADTLRASVPEDQRAQADRIKAAIAGAECGPLCKM